MFIIFEFKDKFNYNSIQYKFLQIYQKFLIINLFKYAKEAATEYRIILANLGLYNLNMISNGVSKICFLNHPKNFYDLLNFSY